MMYLKCIQEFRKFISAYENLEFKQHKIYDLNLSEVHFLKFVNMYPNQSLKKYADDLQITRSAITQMVNNLERKKTVIKSRINNKSFTVVLTEKGLDVCTIHDNQHKKIEQRLIKILNEHDETFYKELHLLIKSIMLMWEEFDEL